MNDERQTDVLICAGLVALVAAIFIQSASFDFLGYDDAFYVTDNPIVQRGLTLEGVRWAFTRSYESGGTYAPLTFLTHMMDCQFYGMWPGGHHITNVILHALNSLLLYVALHALTRVRWPSALVAAMFAAHPMRAESVAWVAERKDLVCGLFFMLCLWSYALYARRRGIRRYLLVLIALTLGLMSKPMLVTMPALLLLLDAWPLKRPCRWILVWEKVPMLALSAATAALTMVTQHAAGFVRSLDQFPLQFRITNTIVSYVRYLQKTLLPINLAPFYPAPPRWPLAIVALCVVLLIAITIVAIVLRKRAPHLIVGWLWFLGTLVPVIGIVQVGRQAMADRYSYIPQIGLLIAIAWSAAAVAKWSAAARHVVIAIACLAVVALTARAADQTRHWKNTEALADHALQVTEDNNVALVWKANGRMRANDIPAAEALYRRALSIDPNYGMAHLNLGNVLARRGEYRQAIEHYQAAIRWRPQLERAHFGMGLALRGLGDYRASDEEFAEALWLSPRFADADAAWGESYEQRGDLAQAEAKYRAALAINPQHPRAREKLAALRKRAATTTSTRATTTRARGG